MASKRKRKHELVDSTTEIFVAPFIWDLCLLCQKQSNERLITPKYEGYLTVVNDLNTFSKHGELPRAVINLDRLDDGSGLLATLVNQEAKFHKSCRNKYDSQKAARLSGEKKQKGRPSGPDQTPSTSNPSIHSHSSVSSDGSNHCLFCDEGEIKDKLVTTSTFGIGLRIHMDALELQDEPLLRKLSLANLESLEAKYHRLCYVRFLTRARASERSRKGNHNKLEDVIYGTVITELVEYMQDMYLNNSTSPVFKLSYLTKLVSKRMMEMGIQIEESRINRTRLKEEILALTPGLRADKSGRDIVFSFEGDVGDAVRDACAFSDLNDGVCLGRAVSILRRHLFQEFPKFEGSFKNSFSASTSVPAVLYHFIKMLLEGPSIDSNISLELPENNAGLSIAQLIRYNSVKHIRKEHVHGVRHSLDSETPLPLYVGIMIHSVTKKKKIIDKLHHLGLSVTYSRVQEVSATLTNVICKQYEEDGVHPPKMHSSVFVTAAIDNIDHNQSSSTAVSSFHGSSVTIIQHPNSDEIDMEIEDDSFRIQKWNKQIVNVLPEFYTTIPPTGKVTSDPPVPTVNPHNTNHDPNFSPGLVLSPWLSSVLERLSVEDLQGVEFLPKVSFAAFHAQNEPGILNTKCSASLLPLLNEEIASPAMVRHMMDIIQIATAKLNENQTPVITCDQPVYAIAKQLQWKFPERYGEDRIIFMMGGLHIEMMVINLLGKWLIGSGWTELVTNSGVASSGVAESCLTSSHVKRSRYAHEVTLTALHCLQVNAYNKACETDSSIKKEGIELWIKSKISDCPQFQYWNTVIELESLLLQLVLSIRTSNFAMYVDTLAQICPWTFALDAVHYSRWLPVFVRTLQELPEKHPEVHVEFLRGHFTSNKTTRPFSAISDDQLHEQNNKVIKGEGGAIGIFDSENALLKWMVAGPMISSLIDDFEGKHNLKDAKVNTKHHEDNSAFEKRYSIHVKEMIKILIEQGNPFEENDLISLGSSKIMPSAEGVKCASEALKLGLKQYEEFVVSRFDQCQKSIHDTIPRTNTNIFDNVQRKPDKAKLKIANLRKDSNLFCRLYVASEARDGNIDDFFSHENHMYPPSISDGGKLRKPTNKSDIVECIQTKCEIKFNQDQPKTSAKILDGAAIIHMLSPGFVKTFGGYYEDVFKPYLNKQLDNSSRIDIVFDRYTNSSLKADTRETRGSGVRIKVTDLTTVPKHFKKFLCVNENKTQFFQLLAKNIMRDEYYADKQVFCTFENQVLTTTNTDVSNISPTSHEEADGRLLLHVKHAAEKGHAHILIRTVDSDVVVIAVSLFQKIQNLDELWIEYGSGKYRKFIPIHEICTKLSPEVCRSLLAFHSVTGCDTVSMFCGVGKKTDWKVWMAFQEINWVWNHLCTGTSDINEELLNLLQRFVILLYDQTSDLQNLTDCRRVLFTKKNRSIENIPPTQDALVQHLKRATHQARIWHNSLDAKYTAPPPTEWGWKVTPEGTHHPLWTTISEMSKYCAQLTSCTCRKRCTSCKCVKMGLKCTKLCVCEGQCSTSDR